MRKSHAILWDVLHPLYGEYELLPSGRRYRVPLLQTARAQRGFKSDLFNKFLWYHSCHFTYIHIWQWLCCCEREVVVYCWLFLQCVVICRCLFVFVNCCCLYSLWCDFKCSSNFLKIWNHNTKKPNICWLICYIKTPKYIEQNYKHFCFCPHFSWAELKDLRLFYVHKMPISLKYCSQICPNTDWFLDPPHNIVKLHILEWFRVIVASLRHTCAIIMLSNQHLDMPHLWGRWIISAKEKCSLTQI